MNARQMIELAARRIQKKQPGVGTVKVAARVGHLLLVGLSDEIFMALGVRKDSLQIDRGRVRLAKALGLVGLQETRFPKSVGVAGHVFNESDVGVYESPEFPNLKIVVSWFPAEEVYSVEFRWGTPAGIRAPRVEAENIHSGLEEVLRLSRGFSDFPLQAAKETDPNRDISKPARSPAGQSLQAQLNEILRDSEPLKEGDPEDPDDPQLGKVGDAPKRTQTLFEHIGKSGMIWWFLHLPDKGPAGETLVFDGRNYKPVLKFKAENQKRILLTKSASSEQWGDIEVAMKDLGILRQEESPKRPFIYTSG